MLIIISHASFIEGEAELVNALFDAGLSLFHLRKPEATLAEIERLLGGISVQHRSGIALHHHHVLAEKYGIHRIHFPSRQRNQLNQQEKKSGGLVYSTSIHEVEEYTQLDPVYSYAFLSPVFDSLSKVGYRSKGHDLTKINRVGGIQLIGLGGINRFNAKDAMRKEYDGIALCGAIWQAEKPIDEFLTIKKEWNTIAQ